IRLRSSDASPARCHRPSPPFCPLNPGWPWAPSCPKLPMRRKNERAATTLCSTTATRQRVSSRYRLTTLPQTTLTRPPLRLSGAFGIQGLDDIAEGLTMGKKDHQYDFKAGRIYNLESSGVIKEKALVIGAHSDIAHPEVAHAWWQAAMVD